MASGNRFNKACGGSLILQSTGTAIIIVILTNLSVEPDRCAEVSQATPIRAIVNALAAVDLRRRKKSAPTALNPLAADEGSSEIRILSAILDAILTSTASVMSSSGSLTRGDECGNDKSQ